MRIELPGRGDPRGPRDPGDAWVVAPTGQRYWGRFGAAGLMAVDPDRGILLQHRAAWSHHGDTWGLPGGARHAGESALDAAYREAAEEAGVPVGAVDPRFVGVLQLGYWSYATLVADVTRPFEPLPTDAESRALAWVPVGRVSDLPLHPGFASSWETLRPLLGLRPAVVVDAANVVGSVPDGWWRDRVAAGERLLGRVSALAAEGLPAATLGFPADVWFPRWVVVLEGRARAASQPDGGGLEVRRAEGSGDDAIVSEAARLVGDGFAVTVVTSDRGLTDRVRTAGAEVRGARWFLDATARTDRSS